MTNEMRANVTEYVYINVGSDLSHKVKLSTPLHPSLRRAFQHISKKFVEICIIDQNLLKHPDHEKRFLSYCDNML